MPRSILIAVTQLPAWFPGATFQRIAQRTRKLALESMNEPFEYVKRNMVRTIHILVHAKAEVGLKAAGSARKSIVSDLLNQRNEGKKAFPEQAVKEVALTVFVGEYFSCIRE